MFARGVGSRLVAIALVAAVVGCTGFATVGRAAVYRLHNPLTSRLVGAYTEYGYIGPPTILGGWPARSEDDYYCPPEAQVWRGTQVVGDSRDSADRWFAESGPSGPRGAFFSDNHLHLVGYHSVIQNWSIYGLHLRAVMTCTNDRTFYGYPQGDERDCSPALKHCGDYLAHWLQVLDAGNPHVPQYVDLIGRVFCWSQAYPGCASALAESRRFALHDGTDTISEQFDYSSSTRPPEIRLTGDAGCTARHLGGSVDNGIGELRLVLSCHALKRGAQARLRIVKPVRVSFRLHRGIGRVRVQLAKPRGTVAPILDVGYGPADKRCSHGHAGLRMRPQSFVLRVKARCGSAAANAIAHLYIGGLIQ
jgi:hypothetical protein